MRGREVLWLVLVLGGLGLPLVLAISWGFARLGEPSAVWLWSQLGVCL